MKIIKKTMDRDILIKEVDFGTEEMRAIYEAEKKEKILESEGFQKLDKEAQEEVRNLELSYVETRLVASYVDVIGVFFKTENSTYLFAIGKFEKDGVIDKDYASFGLDRVERRGNFYDIGSEEYVHDAIKKVVIQMIEKTNYQFFASEKIQEYNEELEIYEAQQKK